MGPQVVHVEVNELCHQYGAASSCVTLRYGGSSPPSTNQQQVASDEKRGQINLPGN